LLPLAEIFVQVQSKLDDGTLIKFVSASPRDEITVKLGVCKVALLIDATWPCVVAAGLSLNYFIENKVDYIAVTGLTKKEYLKIINVATLPIALLTQTDGGLQSLASQLLKETDEGCKAILDGCSEFFLGIFDSIVPALSYMVRVLKHYKCLPGLRNVANLSTLPRPPLLTDSDAAKAMIKLSSLINTLLESPLCDVPDTYIFRRKYFISSLDCKGNEDVASAYWEAQLEDDLFSAPFAIFLNSFMEVRTQEVAPAGRQEKTIPNLCEALVLNLTALPFESCSRTVASLSTPTALKAMEQVGLDLLQLSKDFSLIGEKRVDICITATILFSFRTFIEAKQFSVVPVFFTQMVTGLPEPVGVLNSMKYFSHAWVECAHCLISMGPTAGSVPRSHDILTYVSYFALVEQGYEVMRRFAIQSKFASILKEETLLALFTGQEAISTMMATAGWVFATFSNEENFGRTNKVIFDVIYAGLLSNSAFAEFLYTYAEDGKNFPKSVALCEAALKSVEAASKALLWMWKISPRQMVQNARRFPSNCLSSNTLEELIKADNFSMFHTAINETLKAVFTCCPPSNLVTAELAGRIGATSLKAFHAMEVNPHEDWLLAAVSPMNVSKLRAESYASISCILRDRTHPVFQKAIVPIVANHVPWLDNAANASVRDPRFGCQCVELSRQNLKEAMEDVVEGGVVQKERAVARAHAMATLHCGYVGCRTIILPNAKGRLCSGCQVVRYCSEACSKADWKKHHKIACKAIAAGAKA